jgi:flagellar basal body-associated protein FliL
MSSSQGDSGGSKNIKSDPRGRRRGSAWGMILLGIALLACALLLFLYYNSNSPEDRKRPDNLNMNGTPSGIGAETPRPTPSPTTSPSKQPEQKSGARLSLFHASSQDEIAANKKSACDLARAS